MKRWALAVLCGFAACSRDPAAIPAVGTLERDRIELTAEANEPITELAAREGDLVTAGQLILQLEPSRLAAQVARAQASRAQLAARLAELERGPRAERIRQARAALAGAKSAVANMESDWQRASQLAEQGIETGARRDSSRAARDGAFAQRDQAQALLEELERGYTSEEIEQARSALAAADAALTESRIHLERLSVRAPGAGRVDALPFKLGERPAAGATVAVLLSADTPYARVYVPEPVRVRIGPGSRAHIRIAGRDGELAGTVRTLSHEAAFTPYYALTQHDRGRLSYLAEVDVDGGAGADLPTGVPVEVRFELGSAGLKVDR
jgi:HlyD family secretion protein